MTAARLRSAVLGLAVRRALVDYLRGVGLIMGILLALAWTIDLATTFPDIRAQAAERGTGLAAPLGGYLLHRAADIVVRLLPMACLFGVLLAEIYRRLRLESTILEAAGYSPRRRLAPILWLGLILGVLQGMLEAYWRPAAVFAQVESGLGTYARWYRQDWLRQPVWYVGDDRALRAEIRRSDDPAMRKLLIFEGIAKPRLTRVLSAERALPLDGATGWRLEEVRIWSAGTEGRAPMAVPELEMTLDIVPQELSYHGIQVFNLPGPALAALAARDTPRAAPVRTALWRRYTAWLLPGAFALLAVVLAQLVFEGRMLRVVRLLALAGLGYVSVVSVKVLWTLGELAVLPAPVAVLTPIALALLLALGLSRRQL